MPAGDTTPMAFVNVTVLPMDRPDAVLASHTVVVRGGRIIALGPSATITVPEDIRRLDGQGRFLMPGFIEAHTHLSPGSGAIGDAMGRQLALLLLNGITTARGLIAPASALTIRDRIANGTLTGPRLYVAGPSLNGQSAGTPAAMRALIASARAAGYDMLKTHGGLSADTYDTMVVAAREHGLPLSGHVTGGYGLARAMEAGQQIEHLDGFIAALIRDGVPVPAAAHGQVVIQPGILDLIDETKLPALAQAMASRGIWHGLTLALFQNIVSEIPVQQLAARPEMQVVPAAELNQWIIQKQGFDAQQLPVDGIRHYLALRDRMARALYEAGALLLVSSDAPQFFLPTGFGFHREMQAMATAGIPARAVLAAATIGAARHLGNDDIGVVAVGRRADLVLLDHNPIESVTHAERPNGVMVNGRWYSRADLDALLEAVTRSANP